MIIVAMNTIWRRKNYHAWYFLFPKSNIELLELNTAEQWSSVSISAISFTENSVDNKKIIKWLITIQQHHFNVLRFFFFGMNLNVSERKNEWTKQQVSLKSNQLCGWTICGVSFNNLASFHRGDISFIYEHTPQFLLWWIIFKL